ncbi:MAG: cytochrome b6-f complex subunit 6 PetL [Phormidesmis priestleyi Ana]|uniref:Cytochrome b6-f complex subunit 6 PetL n=1 Tax=Phormidesmis priestleyi Ana TaxID=1666911 RepID=A0A0P7ZV33_9CYAN|nr:MAG: cytochrome b6-f complex subunit 6 PetL [Phormidesmis priestleyi Ana]
MGGAVIYVGYLVALFGTAMGLYFGLRTAKII